MTLTERDIAEKFNVVWKQHLPLLTSNFMRVFNEAQIEKVNRASIPLVEDLRYDLVSEAAFILCSYTYFTQTSPKDYLAVSKNTKALIENTAKVIWKRNIEPIDLVLHPLEKKDILNLCDNIYEFIIRQKNEEISFKPIFPGYGVIPNLEGDLSIGDTLYEIKTVNRNFKSSDLKQLFIYLALTQATGRMKWKFAGLYNPRKGTFCKFNIRSLIYNLSGGNSTNETFENLLNSLNRDLKLDSKF